VIHPSAIVDPSAQVGKEVRIGPYAVIAGQVSIGDGCEIGPHAVIHRWTTLGPGCRVHAGAVLGDWPQDVSFKNEDSFVRIGARCIIREGVTIHRGTRAGSETVVGDDCFLMVNSHLGHNVRLGNGVLLVNGSLLAGHVEVGDKALISGNCMVHQFARIGRLAMLSGGAGIGKDVPPFCVAHGVSVNRISGINVIGLRRAGFAPEERMQVKKAFKLLYRSGLNVSQAVAEIERAFPAGPAREMTAFIQASKRGICAAMEHPETDDPE
jgi:UDP-N-acetylglucosamine acyltransferase